MFRRDIVGMRAVSLFSRERQHLWTQRCDNGFGRLRRRRGSIMRLLHALEVSPHRLDRLTVMLTAKSLNFGIRRVPPAASSDSVGASNWSLTKAHTAGHPTAIAAVALCKLRPSFKECEHADTARFPD